MLSSAVQTHLRSLTESMTGDYGTVDIPMTMLFTLVLVFAAHAAFDGYAVGLDSTLHSPARQVALVIVGGSLSTTHCSAFFTFDIVPVVVLRYIKV